MPPIMGAGAFVMASFTQISYERIVAVAALPALLYFLSVAFFVRIEAKRLELPPMENDGETLGTGQTLLVNTGDGTQFDSRGNYQVTLQVRYDGNIGNDQSVNFVTGGSLFLPGDFVLTSVDNAILTLYSVPEPYGLLLLAPGLAFIARRQRKKRGEVV